MLDVYRLNDNDPDDYACLLLFDNTRSGLEAVRNLAGLNEEEDEQPRRT
jgi:hypothetical protein